MARITAHMKELGGGRYWDWKEKNIMKRLHELGLEEIISDPSTGAISRRKRRVRRDDGSEQLAEGWSQHGEVGGHHNGNHLMAAAVAVTVSSPQKLPQELESQLFQTLVKVETRDSPASVGGGAGSSSDQPQYGSAMEHNQQHRQRQRAASGAGSASESERLARQVCAQMMQERHH